MNEKNKKFINEWISLIILAVLINKFLIFKAYIPSESMKPTINKDDRLLIGRIHRSNSIKRGDILVFKSDELSETLIKMVIGLSVDSIIIEN